MGPSIPAPQPLKKKKVQHTEARGYHARKYSGTAAVRSKKAQFSSAPLRSGWSKLSKVAEGRPSEVYSVLLFSLLPPNLKL